MTQSERFALPGDLPVPRDDGACDHLRGESLVRLALEATDGRSVDLGALRGWAVVFVYPRTGRPETGVPNGWDAIPGARGCTPQSCGFRDLYRDFQGRDVHVFGLSAQTSSYQREVVERLHLPFPLLSDAGLAFVDAHRLPTFDFEGERLIKRMTLILCDGVVEHLRYPVFPPDRDAVEVLATLEDLTRAGEG